MGSGGRTDPRSRLAVCLLEARRIDRNVKIVVGAICQNLIAKQPQFRQVFLVELRDDYVRARDRQLLKDHYAELALDIEIPEPEATATVDEP